MALTPATSRSSLAAPATVTGGVGFGPADFAYLLRLLDSTGDAVHAFDSSGGASHELQDNAAAFFVEREGGQVALVVDGTGFVNLCGTAGTLAFFNGGGATKRTGVAVSAAGIHAALVSYGLISA